MKKRGMFYVIFLLILIPNAYSIYEELIYSGTVKDGDIIEIADSLFEFRIDSVSNKTYVDIDISGVIISNRECKIKDNFDVCIKEISYSHRDNVTYFNVYKADVEVYHIKSKIDIKNTIEKDKILIDEETIAELTIENTADIVAKGVRATMDIPSSILITNVEGCKKTFDTLIFEADVHPNQIRKCTYKVQGLIPDEFELTANVTFFDGIEQINTTSDTIEIKVYNYSLKITPILNKIKFEIGEEPNLTINIENINDQYDLTITTLLIKLHKNLLVIKKPIDTTLNNNIITWRGTLAPQETKQIEIFLQSKRTGNFSILTESSYKIEKFFRKAEEKSNIEIDCDCPYIIHEFLPQTAVSEKNIRLKAFLINPSKVKMFRNVKVSYLTDIPNIQDYSKVYSELKPLETIKIFDSTITSPPLDEIYNLNLKSVYEASNSQVFVVKDNIIIKTPSAEELGKELGEQQVLGLDIEKNVNTTNEIGEKEDSGELLVTTLTGEKTKYNFFTIIIYIVAIIFILLAVILFKRKRGEKKEIKQVIKIESKVDKIDSERHNVLDFLSNIRYNNKDIEMNTEYRKKENKSIEDLEKQIQGLNDIFKKKKNPEKLGLFRGIFKRK